MSDDVAGGPLTGIRVLDISTVLAGPMCAQLLGDFGAEVIKVEHPRYGDPFRGHGPAKDGVPLWWAMLARNKRTIGLDLGQPDGADVFKELVRTADVVVENFRPGTLERWGIGPEVLHAIQPGLVIVRVTGFGQEGPYRTRAGFGTLAEAMSGFAAATGEPDGPPTLPPFGLADSICAISAALSAVMSLYHRDAARGGPSGRGQVVDISILEPIVAALGPGPTIWDQLGVVAPRTGNRSANNAPRNTYQTADDRWVAISTSTQSIAERVMRLVGHPEVIDEPWFAEAKTRALHADLVDQYVGGWIASRPLDEVVEAFAKAGAALAPVYTVPDLLDDPQVQALDMITTVDDPRLGPVRMQNVLFRLSETPGAVRHTGREPGADTDAVLGDELGLSPERLADLRKREIVA